MTIIIPAYNCAKYLPRALNSLVAQTDQNFNVVLVDDCSIEDIKSISDQYNMLNLTYIRNT
jgi:glycosyltransferase involved in cell wall biosynthesis